MLSTDSFGLPRRRMPQGGIPLLALALVAAGTGCYRATGISRPSALASEIPADGGDRVHGLKAEAGPGDYYLGNDYIELAVDGALFGVRDPLAGARSGGSIVDLGYVNLDTSFHRVSMPGDRLHRLTPVVNQDPDLPLYFDRITPLTEGAATLRLEGGLLDPLHKLGAATDAQGRVSGISVTHTLALEKTDRFFLITTTLTNRGAATLPIRNLADALVQAGAGYRAVIPATGSLSGAAVGMWGVDFPGTNLAQPLEGSVKAPNVGFMGAESAGAALDSHASWGIMPMDADQVVVAATPQNSLTETRPFGAQLVVVGSLPASGLAPGQSLTYTRRLYLVGGTSQDSNLPAQLTGLFNTMAIDRNRLKNATLGAIQYSTFGTAVLKGPLQTEIRWERDLGGGAWGLERIEWREGQENLGSIYSSGSVGVFLPTGTYRAVIRNREKTLIQSTFTNVGNADRPDLLTPLLVEKDKVFTIGETLAPERDQVVSAGGVQTFNLFSAHLFSARAADGTDTGFQPMKITLAGLGVADPNAPRYRSMGGIFSPVTKKKEVATNNFGAYQFQTGNQIFGTAFRVGSIAQAYFLPGTYKAYATRGPLSRLESLELHAYEGQQDNSHAFTIFPAALPAGWTSFDLPGASQATTGGMLPAERLSSGLAEHVQVIACTEQDLALDAKALRDDFRMEFLGAGASDTDRAPIGEDPILSVARSASLGAYGQATALFPPVSASSSHGGARPSKGWTLADFIAQAEGTYTIVHRPRGPQGLFTLKGFDRTAPLGAGANAWWIATGPQSLGKTQGAFDALELIRAEGFDPANPTPWFEEFKSVRADWFALLRQQAPGAFTKGLGLSAAKFSVDTPVGHARTYLKVATTPTQDDQSPVLAALKSGAAVASTGPLLDVTANGTGPGGTATATGGAVTLTVNLYAPDWVPVEEVRIVVNGAVVQTLDPATFTAPGTDFRLRTATVNLALPTAKDAFLVVEAGVPLGTSGAYRPGTPWAKVERGIYPLAVTNPIFLDLNGGGYTAPGL